MSNNIFLHEFRNRLKSVIIWSLSLIGLIFIFFSIFPSFADQAQLMNEMMEKFPQELKAAFGMNNMDLATVLGYFSFLFIFVQICLAVQASNYGFGLVSVEENELTADFLLSKPVSRLQILSSKLLSAIASLIVTDLVVWITTYISFAMFREDRTFDKGILVLLFISMIIFQFFYLSVGLVISLLVKRVRNVTPYSLGLSFGTYVLNAFSGMFGDIKLELITPFKHFDPTYIVNHKAFNTPLVLINLSVTLVCLGLSYWLYIRRDIPAIS